MYVVRTETTAYGSASAMLAYARLRELLRSGQAATVTDSIGRPLDAERLQAIAAAETRAPHLTQSTGLHHGRSPML